MLLPSCHSWEEVGKVRRQGERSGDRYRQVEGEDLGENSARLEGVGQGREDDFLEIIARVPRRRRSF